MENKVHLIVDVGNTTIVFAVFGEHDCFGNLVISSNEMSSAESKSKINIFLKEINEQKLVFDGGMIYSVVPSINNKIAFVCKKYFGVKPSIFDWENYEYSKKDPRITDKIGADLVADLIAADRFYGGPAMIMDLGTVNKLLLIDEKGIFTGVSFMTGMESALKAFMNDTDLLPEVKMMSEMKPNAGLGTVEAMKHGIYWSTVGFVEHQRKIQEELAGTKLKLILTGGNSCFVKDEIKDNIYDPLLTVKGMNIMYMEAKK